MKGGQTKIGNEKHTVFLYNKTIMNRMLSKAIITTTIPF